MPAQVFHLAGVLAVHAVAGVAGDEDTLAERYRRGGACAGELDLPDDVLRGRPFGRQALLVADALPSRTAELRPVRPGSDAGGKEQGAGGDGQTVHEMIPPCGWSRLQTGGDST